jgi:hypothetical protein
MKKNLWLLMLLAVFPVWAEKQIAVGENPSEFEKIAAEELKLFLEKITSNTYSIVPENRADNPVVFLGETDFSRKHGIVPDQLGREELILKSVGRQLIISGGRPVGTLYGVYAFLQRNGVYFLSWDGTVVLPEAGELGFSGFDVRKSPSIKSRFIYDQVPIWMFVRQSPQKYLDEYWRFQLRNRSGGKQDICPPGQYLVKHSNTTKHAAKWHSFFSYVNPKEHFATHPEYFTMTSEGKRVPDRQLCLSNPDVAKVATESLRGFIRRDRENPKADRPVVYDITQRDNTKNFCECPDCREIVEKEGHSGLLWGRFINPIANAIAKEYPDIQIRTYAYAFSDQLPPPHIKPAPNTVTFYCNMYLATDCYRPLTHPVNKKQLDKYSSWKSFGAPILMWDYWNMGMPAFFDPPRIETGIDGIIGNIRLHQGEDGIFAEYEISRLTPQMFFALDNFVALQLMYDAEQDPEKLIDIFMGGYYGAAAADMRSILEKIRTGVAREPKAQTSLRVQRWNYINAAFLLELYRTLKQAEAKVKNSPVYLRHIHTEMIVPLWTIVGMRREVEEVFRNAGYDMEMLKSECRALTTEHYWTDEPARPQGIQGKSLTLEPLEKLLKEYSVPEKFAPHADKVFLFPGEFAVNKRSYYCSPGDDPESPYGKAAVFSHPDAKYHTPSQLRFVVGGSTTPKAFRISPVPQDEKYHWYCIRRVGFSPRTWLDAWQSFLVLHMSSAYRIPSGIEDADFNHYDVWFSVRVTGPAYVADSTLKNAVYLDMAVLTPPGLIP